MGVNNRKRRAAKAKQRNQRRHRGHGHGRARGPAWGEGDARRDDGWGPGPGGGRSQGHSVTEILVATVEAAALGERRLVDHGVQVLLAEPPRSVAVALAALVERQVSVAWRDGWQPADLARYADRQVSSAASGVLRAVVAAEARTYAELGARVAPAWMAQLDDIGAPPAAHGAADALGRSGAPWPEVLAAGVDVLAVLIGLPVLPLLADPPHLWHAGAVVDDGTLPAAVLGKVRALLAKAESTTFDAEADALTAKAQQLMARHRIDQAVLDAARAAEGGGQERPVGRRIGIDDPYAEAKATLLAGIAAANGAHAVWSKGVGFSTVFGFPGELHATEELFTSLLVQATAALRREGSRHDAAGRSRTTRFRRSFLVAFAHRVTQRLHEAVEDTVAAAASTVASETGTALVPLLDARDAASKTAAEDAFPELDSFSPTASDREGWMAGTIFGDQADLGLGPELERRPA